MKFKMITQEKLKELLIYDPDTGIFIWKERSIEMFSHCKYPLGEYKRWNKRYNGVVAGAKTKRNKENIMVLQIKVLRKNYLAQRLAWLYSTGMFPENKIDHINGDSLDNRFINLRDVDNQENNKNKRLYKRNKSGFCGVSFNNNKWRSDISINNRNVYLGSFINKEDAIKARIAANIKYNFHENHGKTLKERKYKR